MKTINASASQITEIEVIEPFNWKSMLIEFVSECRVYDLEITQDMVDYVFGVNELTQESAWWTLASYTESLVELSEITEEEMVEVAQSFKKDWYDVTDSCPEKVAIIRKQARRSLLSYIVTSANKLRSTLKSMSEAMHTAWTKARILASGIVSFVKVGDVDKDEDVPVYTRRVADGGTGKNGLMLFKDLEKYENYLKAGLDEATATAKSFISMHAWQVVSWS